MSEYKLEEILIPFDFSERSRSALKEVAWLAGKTAKIALSEVMEDAMRLGFMTNDQAEKAGRMILHDNAARLYNL